MGRREDRARKDLFADLMEIVDAGRLDWRIEVHPAQGSGEIDLFDLHVAALPAKVRASTTFATTRAELRAGYDYRVVGRYAPYGSRADKLTSPAVEHAQAAGRYLGLLPPAPKSFEIIVRRHQRARGSR